MEKMNLAQSLLEGEAESWFYSLKRSIFRSWEHLVDLLIWWFGDVNEFGDFIDPELFRLWDKNARILQARRVEKRRKRMETTSLNLQESISNQQKIVEESSENVAENLDEKASEKKLISQFQVPVSSLEPSLRFSTESLVVSEARPSEIVSTNRVHSQSVLDCVKNKTNAYQVFDKTSPHKERLKPKTKRKLRLSLKTWMFKFKHASQKRKSLDVKFFSVEEISWLPTDPKEIYRSCVDNEFKEVVAGCGKKLFDRFQTSPSYALDVVNKTSKPWETHMPFTSTHVASVNSLSFAVGTADKFELCVGHETGIMSLTLLLHSGFAGDRLTELDFHISEIHGLLVFPWNLMLLEFLLFLHLEDKVCLSAASNSCYGWMVFDRGKNIKILGDVITLKRDDQPMLVVKAKDVHMDSLIVRIKVILSWAEIQKISLYKELWIKNMVEINTRVSWAELKWIICSVSSNIVEATKVNVNSETRHGVCIILIFKREPKLEGNHAMIGFLGISRSCFGNTESVLVMVLYFNLDGKKWYTKRQQTSSSTWHRWRRKD